MGQNCGIFFFKDSQVSPGIRLNTREYNVWGIKLMTKVIRLHKL